MFFFLLLWRARWDWLLCMPKQSTISNTNVTYIKVQKNASTQNCVCVIWSPQADLPQAQGSWAQASDSLAPPAEQDCPCHRLSVPWSIGQTLRTYYGMHCLSPAEQYKTAPLRHQTPWQECKLQNRTGYRWEKKGKGKIVKHRDNIHNFCTCMFTFNNILVFSTLFTSSYYLIRNLPRQANPAAEEASPAAVGKLFTEQMWTLWDKPMESNSVSPSLRLFLASRRTMQKRTHPQKDNGVYSTF